MVLKQICSLKDNPAPLELVELPDPVPQGREVMVKISACGVCHTELDEIEGRTPPPHLPVVLGHQAVGRIVSVKNLKSGGRLVINAISKEDIYNYHSSIIAIRRRRTACTTRRLWITFGTPEMWGSLRMPTASARLGIRCAET
jgi:D-arabinose 1-dehydrogenase-like Zn-dependent alcohol dehydrogenase